MPKPNPGDIVFISGWDGVIGKCIEYDEEGNRLTLQFPKNLSWNGVVGQQQFYPVKLEDIRILSAEEVFEKMADMISGKFEEWRRNLILDITKKPPLSL